MKRLVSIIFLMALAVGISVGLRTIHAQRYFILHGSIVIDGQIDEWDDALTLFTISPASRTEYLFFYFLYNDTHLLIAGKLYDFDKQPDDYVTIYINTTSGIQSWTIYEGSSAYWYYATQTSYGLYNWYFECAIPNSSIGSHEFKLLIEYTNTHTKTYRTYIPYNANLSDPSTWVSLSYFTPSPSYVQMSIVLRDRENHYLSQIKDIVQVRIYNSSWDSGYIMLGFDSCLVYNVSIGAYNLSVIVYGNKIYRTSVDVTPDNYSFNISIPSILIYNITDTEFIVVTVDENSTLQGIYCRPDLGYITIVVNASNGGRIWIDSKTPWRYSCVLFSDNFTYNPITNHLLSIAPKGVSTITILTGENEPVIYHSNSSINRYTFDLASKSLVLLLNGTSDIDIFYELKPFSAILNGTALCYDKDWAFDSLLNITSIKTGKGVLVAYYQNPVDVIITNSTHGIRITIASPYTFNARIIVKGTNANIDKQVKVVNGINEVFIELPYGSYTVKVYDEDSQNNIITESVEVTKLPITTIQIPIHYYLIVPLIIALIIALLRLFRKTAKRKSKYWVKSPS